jgi:hypothetical protein
LLFNDKSTEDYYRDYYTEKNIKRFRVFYFLGVLVYLTFLATDPIIKTPSGYGFLLSLSVYFFILILLGMISFSKRFCLYYKKISTTGLILVSLIKFVYDWAHFVYGEVLTPILALTLSINFGQGFGTVLAAQFIQSFSYIIL